VQAGKKERMPQAGDLPSGMARPPRPDPANARPGSEKMPR
jgi:hypothetical protein